MGRHDVTGTTDDDGLRTFTSRLLDDVRALERMLEEGRIESGVRRIGAEQEFFLVDRAWRPAPVALEVLRAVDNPSFTTELALFNLEINLSPQDLGSDCLSRMERELSGLLERARSAADACDARVLLCGILPTLEQSDLTLDNMTPNPRYKELSRTMAELRGESFTTLIKGLDELHATHDNVMLEACNTSFQVHFQVSGDEFAQLYNLAQAVTAPVLAAAVNSPVLLQHRLWKETRVALFQQSLDVRSHLHKERGSRQRVSFGDAWIEDSVLEIFREDIARFRVLLSGELGEESATEVLDRGGVPDLAALCMHNGTVYRWNRPCYGVGGGKPHLRIENRVLPSGPTVLDEMANAAFFFGLMCALDEEYGDVRRVMSFDDAKANFMAAARYGLKARLQWVQGKPMGAEDLILELLPRAREGLTTRGLDGADVDRFLGVIEDRVKSGQTGARWALDSLAGMEGEGHPDERYRALTAAISERQADGSAVHSWELARLRESDEWRHSYKTVGQVMSKDLFTVHAEDLVDLAASLMEWEHIRHVPVEDHEGRLVGLVSHRALLRLVGSGLKGTGTRNAEGRSVVVREIMKADPVFVAPETSTLEAIEVMRANKVGCLPVVSEGRLVGIVSERDFIEVAGILLDRELRRP